MQLCLLYLQECNKPALYFILTQGFDVQTLFMRRSFEAAVLRHDVRFVRLSDRVHRQEVVSRRAVLAVGLTHVIYRRALMMEACESVCELLDAG